MFSAFFSLFSNPTQTQQKSINLLSFKKILNKPLEHNINVIFLVSTIKLACKKR